MKQFLYHHGLQLSLFIGQQNVKVNTKIVSYSTDSEGIFLGQY